MRQTRGESGLALETKLLAPATRPGWVDRPALAYELERGAGARLTLVSAPVGAGKSTLLAQWAATSYGRDFAWLTLDRGDNSPTLFWTYVVSALRTVRPGFGEQVLRLLRAPGVVVDDDVLPLLADAADELDSVTLVLDDFQTITDDGVHEGLLYLIERLPSGARVVIATQVDPPLPLEQLRAEGGLCEIRDLGLTADQTAALLRTVLRVELERDDVRGVHEWTEGWVAGVQLAALSAGGHADPLAVLNALPANAQNVVDYVWDRVLAGQRPEVRRFLAETSILDRFSAPLCAAVSERDDAEQLLAELERSNAFLVTLDASTGGTATTRSFAMSSPASSQRCLELTWPVCIDGRASGTRRRDSPSRRSTTQSSPTTSICDRSPRPELALPLQRRARIQDPRLARPSAAEVLASDTSLCLLAANMARSLGRRDEVERWLAVAEAEGPLEAQLPGLTDTTAAAVAINRSMLALGAGDAAAALAEVRRAEASETDPDGLGRVVASFFIGVVLFFADDESAEVHLDGFLSDPRTADQHARAYAALAFLAYIALDRRDVAKALRLADEALERAHAHGLDEYPTTSLARGALGDALLASGDLEGAEKHLEQAVTLARRGGEGCDIALAQVALARLRVRQRDYDAARDALASARSALDAAGLPRITRLDRELSRLLLRAAPAATDTTAAAEASTEPKLT